ncbi:MAG: hypothetical protein IT365_23590 [Candidatus Hydrogenedentes bacterium]|nr:hypothetical protein [Candidatus Hydrogenedentota bacterium]
MASQVPESDWKRFKIVREKLLERFCERVIAEIASAMTAPGSTAHERYLKIYRLLKQRDEELADAFNDLRRSTALDQLLIMQRMGLLEDEDRQAFTAETQDTLRRWNAFLQEEAARRAAKP